LNGPDFVVFFGGVYSEAGDSEPDRPKKTEKLKLLTLGGGREVELLTIDEVAKSLGQCSETIRRLIWGGHLGSIKLGGRVFVRREQIDDYITRCTRPRSAEAIKRGRGRPKVCREATALAVT
jgi:excisionase family DNA binding protein